MELNETRLIALVNRLVDVGYPDPDGPEPIGPWGPWIREALKVGPLPEAWAASAAASTTDSHWWQDYYQPGPPPRFNWSVAALLRDLASLNPQPLPPVDGGIGFARALAHVALRRAREARGEQQGSLLLRFAEDWCGTVIRIPIPPKPGDPGEPRPPRPEESLVLGAALVRAAGSREDAALKKAAEDAGRRIFEHGLSGL